MSCEDIETKLKAKNINNDHIKFLRKLYIKAPPENLTNLQPGRAVSTHEAQVGSFHRNQSPRI